MHAPHTYPFLSVGVLEVRDTLRVPLLADAEEQRRSEPVLSHDDEVGEEPSARLDHPDLTVRDPDQSATDTAHERHMCCT